MEHKLLAKVANLDETLISELCALKPTFYSLSMSEAENVSGNLGSFCAFVVSSSVRFVRCLVRISYPFCEEGLARSQKLALVSPPFQLPSVRWVGWRASEKIGFSSL